MSPEIHSRPRRESGFSLIEVLISLSLLVFGMVVITEFSRAISQAALHSNQLSDAVRLARAQMEQLRRYSDRAGYEAIVGGSLGVNRPSAAFQLTWTVADATPPFKVIQMKTSWNDSQGTSQQIELNSVIAWFDPVGGGRILQ
ncbi:MAG: prepilin-type N-terminal cleavage/methylation domain-containing protein [Magnetococcales bacterium]|nr:prepilin-type N-terminal cleavage/methylation domain-containing protein [Magnetococcales bacterium]